VRGPCPGKKEGKLKTLSGEGGGFELTEQTSSKKGCGTKTAVSPSLEKRERQVAALSVYGGGSLKLQKSSVFDRPKEPGDFGGGNKGKQLYVEVFKGGRGGL